MKVIVFTLVLSFGFTIATPTGKSTAPVEAIELVTVTASVGVTA